MASSRGEFNRLSFISWKIVAALLGVAVIIVNAASTRGTRSNERVASSMGLADDMVVAPQWELCVDFCVWGPDLITGGGAYNNQMSSPIANIAWPPAIINAQ